MPPLEDHSSILSEADARKREGATAHRRPHRHEGFLRLCICPSLGASLPLLSLIHPQIFPSTNSGKEARNCILAYTVLWRTKATSIKDGELGGFLLFFCFLVVNVGNKRPFSKPLPFQICPGLNSGDSKPHLPTSCSRLEPNTCTPRFFALQLRAFTDGQPLHGRSTESLSSVCLCLKRGGLF